MRRFYSICMLIAALIVLSAIPVICQETKEANKETAVTPAPETAAPEAAASKTTAPETAAPVAQETTKEAPVKETAVVPEAVAPSVPAEESAAKTKDISIYGEVQAIDLTANSMNVQYYDYDSDEEKTITLTGDNNTKFENAKLLNDVKKGDWVDATYTVNDGKNIAKLVSVEKEEEAPAASPAETPKDSSMAE